MDAHCRPSYADREDLSENSVLRWEEATELGHNNLPSTGFIYNLYPYIWRDALGYQLLGKNNGISSRPNTFKTGGLLAGMDIFHILP